MYRPIGKAAFNSDAPECKCETNVACNSVEGRGRIIILEHARPGLTPGGGIVRRVP
jgi:hypothetical protein